MSVLFDVLQVQFPVRLEKVKDGKKQGYQTAPHTLMLWGECQALGIVSAKKDVFGDPFAHHVGQFSCYMQSMPNAADVVEIQIGGVVDWIESTGVRGNAVL